VLVDVLSQPNASENAPDAFVDVMPVLDPEISGEEKETTGTIREPFRHNVVVIPNRWCFAGRLLFIQGDRLMSAEDEVRKASEQFYAAVSRMIKGDAGSLSGIWSHSATATAMHPIGGRQVGWDKVKESFQQVAGIASEGWVKLNDQMIQVNGDMAYELGVEEGRATLAGQQVTLDMRVTNIYSREAGSWKIVHHHTDLSPAMLDVLKRLQAK
jgi:ketosteroid isomerase-like protein